MLCSTTDYVNCINKTTILYNIMQNHDFPYKEVGGGPLNHAIAITVTRGWVIGSAGQ